MSASKINFQYPAQTGAYKVFVKDKGLWRNHSTCRLQISVGNPKHSGDKFFALTEWAAARFEKVIFIISDSLQRHNIALQYGIGLEEAHDLALIEGREWMARNKAAIEAVPQRVVTLWDDWLSHADYVKTRRELDCLYAQYPILQEAVMSKAAEFCQRHGGNESAVNASISYILEEVAAFAVMFRQDYAINIYPGMWFKDIFGVVAELPASDKMAGFQNAACMRVDFTRNKSVTMIHDERLGRALPSNDAGEIPAYAKRLVGVRDE